VPLGTKIQRKQLKEKRLCFIEPRKKRLKIEAVGRFVEFFSNAFDVK
jgi:hypothetical protein